MGAPSFVHLFQASTFELVCDTARGHTSQFAPSTPPRRRRNRDGSPSRGSSSSDNANKLSSKKNRWDASSPSKDSPVKPEKSKVDMPPSLKNLCRPPCTLRNVPKPVRRLSIDSIPSNVVNAYSNNEMKTSDILADVLDKLSLLHNMDEDFDSADDNSLEVKRYL